jgi:hypothetical protein
MPVCSGRPKRADGALCAARLPDGSQMAGRRKQRHASLYRCLHILLEGRHAGARQATACITLIIVGMHHSIIVSTSCWRAGMQAPGMQVIRQVIRRAPVR